MIIVERHDRRVGIHVGFDGRDVLDGFDGHTGPLRGAPSNDSGCGELVGHEFGERPRGEKLGEDSQKPDSFHVIAPFSGSVLRVFDELRCEEKYIHAEDNRPVAQLSPSQSATASRGSRAPAK